MKNSKYLLIPIIILGIHFLIRLINQSQIIFQFPFDYTNDYGGTMVLLFFLAKFGFHGLVTSWYNGFILFQFYPPGFFFMFLPLYLLTKNITLTIYLSLLIMFVLGFLFLYLIGKTQKLTFLAIVAFFLFFFGNAINTGAFIRLGTFTSMFGWIIFLALAGLMLWYRNHTINWKYWIIFIPLHTLLIITHFSEVILFQLLILGLFLVKGNRLGRVSKGILGIIKSIFNKERRGIIVCWLISLVLSAFWWIPFLNGIIEGASTITQRLYITRILNLSGPWFWTSIASFIVPIILWFSFYCYYSTKKPNKKELLFFAPILILSVLFISRLVIFIPIIKRVYADPHMVFYIFFSAYFLLKSKYHKFSNLLKKTVIIGLILISIASVSVSVIHTPLFIQPSEISNEVLDILNEVKGKFLILDNPYDKEAFTGALNSYAPICCNLETSSGWLDFTMDDNYIKHIRDTNTLIKNKDCKKLKDNLRFLNTTDIITFDESCNTLKECDFKEVDKKEHTCLYVYN